MMNNSKIDELLKVLTDKGMSQDEIDKIKKEVLDSSYDTFLNDTIDSFSDEDLQKIDALATQEEANEALKKLYSDKTGKDAQVEMQKIIEQKATEHIEKYKTDAPSEPAVSTETPEVKEEIAKAEDELQKIVAETPAEPTAPQDSSTSGNPTEPSHTQNWQ